MLNEMNAESVIKKADYRYGADICRKIAHAKRFLELWTTVPGFQSKSEQELRDAIAEYRLDISLDEIKVLYDVGQIEAQKETHQPVSGTAMRYRRFIHDKLMHRAYLQLTGCVPENKKFAKWRRMQVNRCWLEFGDRNASMIHSPVVFELSDGCSVGCSFCGLNTGKLRGYYRNTPENMALWKGILRAVKEKIGPAAASGTCYYATEPFDHPDYESFSDAYQEALGLVPQITTAAAMRKPERTRRFLERVRGREFHIHRFSILSLQDFFSVLKTFTPEELLFVELLPQFEEATANKFAVTGRNYSPGDRHLASQYPETISCISGFVVNMARRQIRLLTPYVTDREHPTGELVLEERSFHNAASFAECMDDMIEKHMNVCLDFTAPLAFKPGVSFDAQTQAFMLREPSGGERPISNFIAKEGKEAFAFIGQALTEKPVSANELAEHLMERHAISPEHSYFIAGMLYEIGIIKEMKGATS